MTQHPRVPTAQVASPDIGEPQRRTASRRVATAPQTQPQNRSVQSPQAAQSEAVPRDVSASVPRQPDVSVQAPAQEVPREQTSQVEEAVPQTEPLAEVPVDTSPPLRTPLPEIDEVELNSNSSAQDLMIPKPTVAAQVPEAKSIMMTPDVEVFEMREVPSPAFDVSVAVAAAVPTPQVEAKVDLREVPSPDLKVSVSQATDVPTPQIKTDVVQARDVPAPSVSASVAQVAEVPTPQVAAQVATAGAVPTPTVAASVVASRPVPSPQVAAQVTAVVEEEPAQVEAEAVASSEAVTPQVEIDAVAEGSEGEVGEEVSEVVEAGAPVEGEGPEGSSEVLSERTDGEEAGGNALQAGQSRAAEGADANNLGAAASPTGSDRSSGAALVEPERSYREERERAVAVLLDNVWGYPQAGLLEASVIIEMPVEGGLTRLMTVYDRLDAERVGPVRSARPYFHELALTMGAVLVHDGGSPDAMVAIAGSRIPTLNAYQRGDLFSRQEGRSAPYNLYAGGNSLREAVNRLELGDSREVRGVIHRPAEEAPEVGRIEVRFGQNYQSGFGYVPELNLYRWVRNGERANDAYGEAVYVDAVLIAGISARPLPNDPEGRLYIPLRDGEATLYLRGRAIEGSWRKDQGIAFTSAQGEIIDLAPFKTWVVMTRNYREHLATAQ